MAVLFGIDRVVREGLPRLGEGPVGVVTNAAATTAEVRTAVEVLYDAGVNIGVIFAPEHGFATSAPAGTRVKHGVEPYSGALIYSLYGDRFEPPDDILASLTWIIVDLPDVGARFYTYLSTLILVMKAAARVGIPVLILDRPNPINGVQVEGPILREGLTSFVGMLPIPVRHGLTLGELAWFANDVFGLGVHLEVLSVQGWRREMWYDAWERPWVPPSPNIPHGETALLYPGMCLIEGTNLSEGRGTPYPFAVVGAPWLDGETLARRLNGYELPGVRFRPVRFTPCRNKYAGEVCYGVQVHVTRREAFRPVRTGLAVLIEARALHPDAFAFLPSASGEPLHFDRLIGNEEVRALIEAGGTLREIVGPWEREEQTFLRRRPWYFFY